MKVTLFLDTAHKFRGSRFQRETCGCPRKSDEVKRSKTTHGRFSSSKRFRKFRIDHIPEIRFNMSLNEHAKMRIVEDNDLSENYKSSSSRNACNFIHNM